MTTVITGLRVSELQQLILGSTGTLFFASSANLGSYKIYEKDLYNTLYINHLSGAFQSQTEDWRYVHITGNEGLFGNKRFYGDITGNNLDINNIYRSGVTFIDVANRIIYAAPSKFADLGSRIMYDEGEVQAINFSSLNRTLVDQLGNVTLDWNNRLLSGDWNIPSSINLSGQRLITGNRTVNTTGVQNISGHKTFYGNVIFFNPAYNANYLNFTSGTNGYLNFSDNIGTETLNPTNRQARDSSNNIVINWAAYNLTAPFAASDGAFGSSYVYQNNINWSDGLISGGWQLTDPRGQVAVYPIYRVLVNSNNIAMVDWGNLFGFNSANLRDDAGSIAMYWPIRQTIASDGTTVTLDWNNRRLSGIWRMNNQAIATGNRIIYATGDQSISGEKKFYGYLRVDNILGINDGDPTIDLSTHTLQNTTPRAVLDWENQYLIESDAGGTTVDWSSRVLSGNWSASSVVVSGRRLLGNGEILKDSNETQSIDYGNRLLKNVLGNITINWDGHTIYDSDSVLVTNWDDRQLFDNAATITCDWQNRVLSGTWTGQNLTIVNDIVSNKLQTFKLILSGNAPSTPTSNGISGQVAMSGSTLFICTGTSAWGRVPIIPW